MSLRAKVAEYNVDDWLGRLAEVPRAFGDHSLAPGRAACGFQLKKS
jgi:hypothetical protein